MMKKKEGRLVPFRSAQKPRYNAAEEMERNIIGLKIREARRRKGLSIPAFRDRLAEFGCNVSVNAAGKWELGYSIPNAYQMVALCLALEIEDQIPFFMESHIPALNSEGERKVQEYRADLIASGRYCPAPREVKAGRFVDMPVSSLAVSAGTGNFLDDGDFTMISFPEDKVPAEADFGIRVSGDSMEPVYHDGQIVWVQECGQLSPGQVGVFIYDGEGYLKIYAEQEPDEGVAEDYTDSYGRVHPQPVLESYNSRYAPRPVLPGAGFRVVGRVL